MRIYTKIVGGLLGLLLLCCSSTSLWAQRGVYLTLDGGMAFGNFELSPSLRTRGEVKWMFLPYLGAGLDVVLQRPGANPNVAPLSAMLSGTVANVSSPYMSSYYTIEEITNAYTLNLIFQPIAIANRETPHILSIALGCGIGLGYSQDWSFSNVYTPTKAKEVNYYYSDFYDFIATVNFSYAYHVYGPLYIGTHVGCMAQTSFSFFYLYAGATLSLRFGSSPKKVTTE